MIAEPPHDPGSKTKPERSLVNVLSTGGENPEEMIRREVPLNRHPPAPPMKPAEKIRLCLVVAAVLFAASPPGYP
jgi:hypothetical protein